MISIDNASLLTLYTYNGYIEYIYLLTQIQDNVPAEYTYLRY